MSNNLLKTKQGHNYIKVSYDDMTFKLGGLGICDSCSPLKEMQNGYLIPVLSSVYCEECFREWESRAGYYEEDISYEQEKTDMFTKLLK